MPEAGILSKYQGKEEFYLSSELPGINKKMNIRMYSQLTKEKSNATKQNIHLALKKFIWASFII